jgi:hypothetical protein
VLLAVSSSGFHARPRRQERATSAWRNTGAMSVTHSAIRLAGKTGMAGRFQVVTATPRTRLDLGPALGQVDTCPIRGPAYGRPPQVKPGVATTG